MSHIDQSTTAGSRVPTYRLGLVTASATLLLIMAGGFTRGSESGYGCADRWPLCEDGLVGGWLPRADYHMIVEWSHRWLAALAGVLVLATAISAWRNHRRDRTVVVSATAALVMILIQAWIGRAIVQSQLDADLVSLHLAISLTVAALLVITVVAVRIPSTGYSAGRGWVGIILAAAGGVFIVIMLGSLVHNLYFPGWPLMRNTLLPDLDSQQATIHFLHRMAAGLYLIAAVMLWAAARRRGRPRHEVTLLGVAAVLYGANVLIGASHVFTKVEWAGLVVLHLGLASSVWLLTVATAASAARLGNVERPVAPTAARQG